MFKHDSVIWSVTCQTNLTAQAHGSMYVQPQTNQNITPVAAANQEQALQGAFFSPLLLFVFLVVFFASV